MVTTGCAAAAASVVFIVFRAGPSGSFSTGFSPIGPVAVGAAEMTLTSVSSADVSRDDVRSFDGARVGRAFTRVCVGSVLGSKLGAGVGAGFGAEEGEDAEA
jgi:hypothetical protein